MCFLCSKTWNLTIFLATALNLIKFAILWLSTAQFGEATSLKTKVIRTKTGKIQGVIEPSRLSGKMVQVFRNVPYAEPPVGNLRFAKPQPKKHWNGTLNSTDRVVACWQEPVPGITFTEDCLILNIWTPYPQPSNASVMVWIHGGAFKNGRSQLYPGQNIVAVGDVILVTINYRLSALGFLSTGDDRIKGNLGLFDQRLAMQWIRNNIASFGGNSQSITIFGESAGGASVSAHTLSNGSWPFFDRTILQSGTMTTPWALVEKASARRFLDAFLNYVNCKNDLYLLECLRNNVTTKELERYYSWPLSAYLWFRPVLDGEFFADHPTKLWEKGTVKKNDIILGITKDESFNDRQGLLQESRNITFFLKKFDGVVKENFKNISNAVYDKFLELYRPSCIPSFLEALKPIVALSSDISFKCAHAEEAKLRSKFFNSTNIYLYQYSYASPVPFSLYPNGNFGFAGHALDIPPTFGAPVNDTEYPAEDQILSLRMVLYWTNFAKTGDPNTGNTELPIVLNNINSLPRWPKFTNALQEFLDMESLSRMIIRSRLREKYCEFLKDPEGYTKKHEGKSGAVKHFGQVVLVAVVILQALL